MLGRLRSLATPIRVGITGMGAMGRGLLYQCHQTPGMECVGIADLDIHRAVEAVESLQTSYRIVDSTAQAEDAIRAGHVAVVENGMILAELESSQALIESTSAISDAARFALTALEHNQHLILMNAEIDLIFGPLFLKTAQDRGLVVASCDGDQHGVIKRVIDEIELWGFEPVMAGNIKGFLDRRANPAQIVAEADKRNLDYKMCTAYTDGTKLNIEMALVANALGYATDVTGMHGPRAKTTNEVLQLFDFDRLRQRDTAVVDYVLGAEPSGGIFVVGYCDDSYQRAMMDYYKMGPGPFFTFVRPYHLCHVEALRCVAEAVLDGVSLLQPDYGFRTNVYAYAKKDLQRGERLDGIGGHCCYGMIENSWNADSNDGLPICLADDVVLRRDVSADERIAMADVQIQPGRFDFRLYQEALEVQSSLVNRPQFAQDARA
jgi:predicted homoserine dehydrogenase-like protein